MVISHRHEFLYFVIPKTGSATLRKSLEPYVDIGWPVSNYKQHETIREFLDSELSALFRKYKKFTFVRNPYDRLYSGYLQDRFASQNYPRWAKAKQPIFDKLGDDFPTYFNEYVLHADIVSNWEWICFCPMSEFALGPDGELAMEFVGRSENLAEDVGKLASFIGLPIVKAADENVRSGLCDAKPKYLAHFDRRTVAAINETYQQDFNLFGYEMLDPERFPSSVG